MSPPHKEPPDASEPAEPPSAEEVFVRQGLAMLPPAALARARQVRFHHFDNLAPAWLGIDLQSQQQEL
jgi:hypothetical protein